MLRLISHETGSCYQRCVGFDAMNALYGVTYEIDEKHGTPYHERLKKFLAYIQENNYMVVGSMTDPKGDRSKGPTQQDLDRVITKMRSDWYGQLEIPIDRASALSHAVPLPSRESRMT